MWGCMDTRSQSLSLPGLGSYRSTNPQQPPPVSAPRKSRHVSKATSVIFTLKFTSISVTHPHLVSQPWGNWCVPWRVIEPCLTVAEAGIDEPAAVLLVPYSLEAIHHRLPKSYEQKGRSNYIEEQMCWNEKKNRREQIDCKPTIEDLYLRGVAAANVSSAAAP